MYGPIPPSAPPDSFITAAAAAVATFRAKVAALGKPPQSFTTKQWLAYFQKVRLLTVDVSASAHDDETDTYWGIEADIDAEDRVFARVYANLHHNHPHCVLGSFCLHVPLTATEADIRTAYNARIQREIATLSALLLPEK